MCGRYSNDLGPGLSGTQAAKEIRALADRPIPILVVTGDTAPERIAEVQESSFDLLHKPVGAEELRRKLAQLLRREDTKRHPQSPPLM